MHVLFLGNSLMFYNDMPAIFEALATAAGKDIHVSSITKGSATISHFADETDPLGLRTREALSAQHWDYVVLEPSRRISPYEDSVLHAETQAAKVMQQLAAQAGAKILLYAVWGNNDGIVKECVAEAPPHMPFVGKHACARDAHAQFLHRVSHYISNELGGVAIAEAGLAFETVMHDEPTIELYHTDLRHPSPAGSYLAACTIYATLFGEKTEGNPHHASLPCAALLQETADRVALHGHMPDLPHV